MTTQALLTLAAFVILIEAWQFHRLMRRAMRPAPRFRPLHHYPSLTVVRPIKGLDADAHLNVRAALDNGYPGDVETIFVFDHEREPAFPLVLDAIREHNADHHHGLARVIFCGEPPAGHTGKLNAMIVGMAHATGELVAFADSDIRPARGTLDCMVDALRSSESAGAVFAPVVVASPLRTVGDAGYALTLNGIYGGAVAAAALLEHDELPFIMGQLMIFEREALSAIGGLSSVQGQFVDDMYIGARLSACGYRNVVAPCSVPIIQQGLPFVEFLRVYRRWIAFSLSGIDWSFTLASFRHAIFFWMAAGLTVLALLSGDGFALALSLAVILGSSWSVYRAHVQLGGAPLGARYAWMPLALLLLTPLLYPTIFVRRFVNWRGRTYPLDAGGRLAPPSDVSGDVSQRPVGHVAGSS